MHVTTRLLIGHFVRRYLENDLASPGADRHQAIAMTTALLASPALFLTVLLAARYVLSPFPLPGETATAAVVDRVFFVTWSMVVLALIALAQWDTLSLDARDAGVLSSLPLEPGRVVRAKLTATLLFGAAAALCLNAVPSVIHPLVSVGRLHATWTLVAWLIVLHALTTVAAGAFGFFAVVALRESLVAALEHRAPRLATAVQTTLVIGLMAGLFLLPPLCANALRKAPADATGAARWLPPLWFVALHERAGGSLVVALPARPVPPRVAAHAQRLAATYRAQRAVLDPVAAWAPVAVLLALTVAMVGGAWNGRRLPEPTPPQSHARRRGFLLLTWLIARTCPHPVTRAGALFTLQTLSRSRPHRLAVGVGLGVGLAASILTVSRSGLERTDLRQVPVALLAAQFLLLASLAWGVRTALGRSAGPAASRMLAMAWSGHLHRFMTGVTLAAWLVLTLPAAVAMPAYARLLGVPGALLHLAVGAALAGVVAQAICHRGQSLPFVDSIVPDALTRVLPALAIPVIVAAAHGVAAVERVWPVALLCSMLAIWGALRAWQHRAGETEASFGRDVRLDTEAQTLGLSD